MELRVGGSLAADGPVCPVLLVTHGSLTPVHRVENGRGEAAVLKSGTESPSLEQEGCDD